MSKEVVVIWHGPSCPDGFGAAWLLRKAYKDATFIPGVYQKPIPEGVEGKHVICVDFSYKRPAMLELAGKAKTLTVLDHHKSAMEDLEGFEAKNAFVFFDMNRSGIRIAWDFIVQNKLLPESELARMRAPRPDFTKGEGAPPADVPWLVAYIEDRDLWRNALPNSEAIAMALRSYPLTDESWDKMLFTKDESLLQDGQAILRSNNQTVQAHLWAAKPFKIDGVEGMGLNASTLFSEIAGELAKTSAFGATWRVTPNGVEWSLRSAPGKADVSKLAITQGGGGHAAAAGFRSSVEYLVSTGLLPEGVSKPTT